MAEFPPTGVKEDSKFHNTNREDSVIRHNTEGGYQVSRPRTTRRPSRFFTTGFTWVTNAQKDLIENFEESKNWGATSFTYDLPSGDDQANLEEVTVTLQKPIEWDYVGIGTAKRWSSGEVVLREV